MCVCSIPYHANTQILGSLCLKMHWYFRLSPFVKFITSNYFYNVHMSIPLCLFWMLTLTTSTSVELQVMESSTSLTCPSLSTVTTLIGTATCRPVRMAVFTISVSCRGKEKNFMSPEVHVARNSWWLVHTGIKLKTVYYLD